MGGRSGRRFGGVIGLCALILALGGCLPGLPSGPRATATPRPTPTATPTATPTPLRIAFPTSAPQRPGATRTAIPAVTATATATPTETPRPTPTATPLPPPELRDAGELLYLGTLDGRRGIVASAADGRDRRLIAEGVYTEIAWAPDGRRFAASVALGERAVPNRIPDALDLFTADGQRLRRFDFGLLGRVFEPIFWSPDSGRVAVTAYGEQPGATIDRAIIGGWILDEVAAVPVAPGRESWVEGWSPDGQLLLRGSSPGRPTPTPQNRVETLWLADGTGGNLRVLAEGAHRALGWSPDGATLYALGDIKSVLIVDRNVNEVGWLSVVAIDRVSGTRRIVAVAGAVAGGSIEPPSHWFQESGSVAPDGGRIAVWSAPLPLEQGTPGPRSASLRVYLPDGALIWTEGAPERPILPAPVWSPEGRRVAYASAGRTLKIVGFGRIPPDTRVLSAVDAERGAAQWSPDGRWIAFSRPGQGLIIARSDAYTIDWVLDERGSGPRWRPTRGE